MARGAMTSRAAAALWSALVATVFATAGAAWLCWWPVTLPLEVAFAVYLSSRVRALQRGKAHVPSSLRVRIASPSNNDACRRARAPQALRKQRLPCARARSASLLCARRLWLPAASAQRAQRSATTTACTSGAAS
jgi:hypothetical protein